MLQQTDTSGTPRTLTQIWQADASGTPRQLQQLWQAGTDGTARLIYSAANASISPASADGYTATKGASNAYTNAVTVSGYPSGSTFTWTVPTGWTVLSPSAASTNFKSPSLAAGDEADGSGSVAIAGGGVTQTLNFDLYASNQGL